MASVTSLAVAFAAFLALVGLQTGKDAGKTKPFPRDLVNFWSQFYKEGGRVLDWTVAWNVVLEGRFKPSWSTSLAMQRGGTASQDIGKISLPSSSALALPSVNNLAE